MTFKKVAVLSCVGVMMTIIVLTGCQVPGGSGGSSSSGTSTATTILSNLGVGAVNNPPPATVTTQTGATMTVDPSTWQPLKNKYAVFTPQAEIFQAGGSPGNGTYWNSFYENGTSSFAMTAPLIGNGGAGGWEQDSAKTSVAADLTGNGVDNIVVFYVNSTSNGVLNDIVYSAPSSGAGKGSFGAPQSVSGVTLDTTAGDTAFNNASPSPRSGIGTPWFPYLSCTKADLKGNGIDEILLAQYKTLYVLSVDPSGSASVLATIAEPSPISSVAAGDYNGSGHDDFIVGLQGNQYALYNSSLAEVSSGAAGGTTNSPVEATFGNFAGNGLQELALCAQATDGNIQVTMYDFTGSNGGMTEVASFQDTLNPFEGNSGTNDYYRMLPRAIDITGKGTDALSVLGSIYENPLSLGLTPTATPAATYAAGSYGSATAPKNSAASYSDAGDNTVVDMQVGNVNSGGLGQGVTDPAQDLIVLSVGENSVPDINVFGLNGSGNFVNLKVILPAQGVQSINTSGTGTTMAVGNFEDNAPRVEYVGHQLTFTNPVVIAALASPPYWSDIVKSDPGYANAYTGWNTTFGETQANSSSSSHSVGFSVGSEIKYQSDTKVFGVTVANFEASVAFTNTNTWEWSASSEVSKSIQYNCPGGQNMVVFTSVPMDQYQYKIIATSDPTNDPVGSSLYITIPRNYSVYLVNQSFYNSNINTSVVQPVSNSVFGGPNSNFTLGDPASYPSPSQMQTLMANGFQGFLNASTAESDYQIAPATVAEGTNNVSGGSTNLDISLTNSTSETISHDFSVDTSVGGGPGDLTLLDSAGFQTGYSTTSTVSTSTTFGGTVGYLPVSYYNNPNYQYSAGLFVYPYRQSNGTTYWVVDYDVTQP